MFELLLRWLVFVPTASTITSRKKQSYYQGKRNRDEGLHNLLFLSIIFTSQLLHLFTYYQEISCKIIFSVQYTSLNDKGRKKRRFHRLFCGPLVNTIKRPLGNSSAFTLEGISFIRPPNGRPACRSNTKCRRLECRRLKIAIFKRNPFGQKARAERRAVSA